MGFNFLASTPLEAFVKHHIITGGSGTQLHLVETGNPEGQPILFLHGFSQCWLSWARQIDSDLAQTHRLVALDLRGHGRSEKPLTGYDDSKNWADDVEAAIQQLELDRPVLCGWSYGPIVMLDYVRYYGEDQIAGMHFVSGITKLGSEAAMSVITPEFASLIEGFFSTNTEQSVSSLEGLLRMCFVSELPAMDLYLMLGFNLTVPPYVRQALFSRALANDDLLQTLRTPVLITHGSADPIVRSTVVDQHAALIPNAEVDIITGGGHAVMWENAPAFNRRLAAFCEKVNTRPLMPM